MAVTTKTLPPLPEYEERTLYPWRFCSICGRKKTEVAGEMLLSCVASCIAWAEKYST